jgi:hypothetical protein
VKLWGANLLKYPDKGRTKCVDWGADRLYILVFDLGYITLRRGTVCLQGAAGLVRRRREGDSLETPVREQHVVGAATLAVVLPECPVEARTVAVSELIR